MVKNSAMLRKHVADVLRPESWSLLVTTWLAWEKVYESGEWNLMLAFFRVNLTSTKNLATATIAIATIVIDVAIVADSQ